MAKPPLGAIAFPLIPALAAIIVASHAQLSELDSWLERNLL